MSNISDGYESAMAMPKQVSGVDSAFSELGLQVDFYAKILNRLSDKLQRILTPDTNDVSPARPTTEMPSGVSYQIMDNADNLRQLTIRFENLVDRIDL